MLDTVPERYKHPDIILAADCVSFAPAFPLLLEPLLELLKYDSEDGREGKPVCWFCMKKRRKADMRFIAALKKQFIVQNFEVGRREKEQYGAIFL